MDKAEVDGAWAGALGISPGEYDTYEVLDLRLGHEVRLAGN